MSYENRFTRSVVDAWYGVGESGLGQKAARAVGIGRRAQHDVARDALDEEAPDGLRARAPRSCKVHRDAHEMTPFSFATPTAVRQHEVGELVAALLRHLHE